MAMKLGLRFISDTRDMPMITVEFLNAEVKYLAHLALVEIEAYIPIIVSNRALPCSIMALTERSGAPRI